jgi:hypothetical protein
MGWMKILAKRQVVLLAGCAATLGAIYLAGLGITWVVLGLAAAEWAAYLLTLSPFVSRGLLATGAVARDQAIHAGAALASYGAALGGVRLTDGASIGIQVVTMAAIALLVCGMLFIFQSWFPAGRILRRRLSQVAPDRGGLAALRLGAS